MADLYDGCITIKGDKELITVECGGLPLQDEPMEERDFLELIATARLLIHAYDLYIGIKEMPNDNNRTRKKKRL